MRAGCVLLAKLQPGSKIRPDTTDGKSKDIDWARTTPSQCRNVIGHTDTARITMASTMVSVLALSTPLMTGR